MCRGDLVRRHIIHEGREGLSPEFLRSPSQYHWTSLYTITSFSRNLTADSRNVTSESAGTTTRSHSHVREQQLKYSIVIIFSKISFRSGKDGRCDLPSSRNLLLDKCYTTWPRSLDITHCSDEIGTYRSRTIERFVRVRRYRVGRDGPRDGAIRRQAAFSRVGGR